MIDDNGNLVLVGTEKNGEKRLPLELFALFALVKYVTGHGVDTEKGHNVAGLRDFVKRNKYESGVEKLILRYYNETDPAKEAEENAKREAEAEARRARAKEAKAPKFDKDRFAEWAKTSPDYLDFVKKVGEAKKSNDAEALKGLLATKDELYAKLKKSYMETLKAA